MGAARHRPQLVTRKNWWLAALVLALHLIFLVAALTRGSFLTDDSIQYLTLSENLSHQGVFSQAYQAPFDPDLQRPPGYPVLLMLCGNLPWLVLILQHLMVLGTGYFLFRLLRSWVGAKWARRGAFFWLLQPYPILMASLVLSEAPFLCLMGLALWYYTKWRSKGCYKRLTLAVAALSLAIYMRPIGLVLLAPVGIDMVIHSVRKRGGRWLAIATLLPALLIGPWILRNGQATGHYTFNSMGPMGMVHGRVGGMEALRKGLPMDEHHWFMAGDSVAAQTIGLSGVKSYYGEGQTHETEVYQVGTGLAVSHFLKHPVEALTFQAKALWGMLRGVGYGWANKILGSQSAAAISAGWQGLCNIILFGGSLLALFRLRSLPPGARTLAIAMALMYLASMAIWADGRYRVPIDLIHLIFATTGIALWTKKKAENLE